MTRHPITFPVSAEIAGSGLFITSNDGRTEFHPSETMPEILRAKVPDLGATMNFLIWLLERFLERTR